MLTDPATPWKCVTVTGWYGGGECVVEISTATAVWRHSGMPVVPIRWVLVRDPLGRFEPQALLCTDAAQDPVQILRWFVQRWQLEVTFREVRDHLGVETQRQWSDQAIARTTPCLLGLFFLVTLLAAQLTPQARQTVATSAWYRKRCPTFSDTLAVVRREFWREQGFAMSHPASNFSLWFRTGFWRQHGHRRKLLTRATVRRRRIVAMECGTWRSGRMGGAARLEPSG